MDVKLIAKVLEIVATILGASFLAGPDRLVRWEVAVQTYLNARQYISYLTRKLQPIIPASFGILYKPIVIVVSIIMIIYPAGFIVFALWWYFSGRGAQYYNELLSNYDSDPLARTRLFGRGGCTTYFIAVIFGLEAAVRYRYISGIIIFSIVGFIALITVVYLSITIGLRAVIHLFFYEQGQEQGAKIANKISYIIYGLVLVPIVIAYILTFVLLTPYLLSEQISVRFQLRPILGVLSIIIMLVALVLELLTL